jgi:phage gp46-like protein
MPDIRTVQAITLRSVTFDWMLSPITGIDQTQALATAIMVALNTDRRALPDDPLPQLGSDDRRGWWGDLDAEAIWNGWPIGSRLWLMSRDKITDTAARQGSTVERARRYIAEALDPFVASKVASSYTIALAQAGPDRITGTVTIYRGPKSAIALEFQDLWKELGG